MPHLSELAKKYEGKVTFVALSDEEVETVGTFLQQKSRFEGKTWGEAMQFAVATDPDKSVKKAIFTAAGQRGIPSSFIISDGKIQWIGHPMGMDGPLAQVVAGNWDLEKARADFAAKAAVQEMMGQLREMMPEAKSSGDWSKVMAHLDSGLEKFPGNSELMMTKWNILLLHAHQDTEAYTLGHKLVEKVWDNAQMLNQIAWTVVDDSKVKTRDLEFAMKAAVRANELTESKDGAILDTLARVHYEAGNLDQAIHLQKMAVEHAQGAMADQLREVLEKYQAEKKAKKGKGTPY